MFQFLRNDSLSFIMHTCKENNSLLFSLTLFAAFAAALLTHKDYIVERECVIGSLFFMSYNYFCDCSGLD